MEGPETAVFGVNSSLGERLKEEQTSLDHHGNLDTVFLKHINKRSISVILSEGHFSA